MLGIALLIHCLTGNGSPFIYGCIVLALCLAYYALAKGADEWNDK